MVLVQGLKQIFVKAKFFIEYNFQNYAFSKKAMNFTPVQKIKEI
jgi:hypothetical protein